MKTFIFCNFDTFVLGVEKTLEAAPNVAPRFDPTGGMGEEPNLDLEILSRVPPHEAAPDVPKWKCPKSFEVVEIVTSIKSSNKGLQDLRIGALCT